ncbi:MAG TPA: adenylate/guanylate cyclase domain-containing protein [Chitinophagaceae bacterium]|nr:adenylate/guanylate cyclase domain-containing protein [Chitinophagaceae bacterium]
MKKKPLGLFLLFIGFGISAYSQSTVRPATEKEADTVLINSLLEQSKESLTESPDKTIALAQQAKDLSKKANFKKGKAYALKNIGLANYHKGNYVETLQNWEESLKTFEQINDETGVANILNNMAAIYGEQGDEEKGLEYSLRSLKISEKLGDKLRILSALNTIGSIYYAGGGKKAKMDQALNYLLRALPICEEIGYNEGLGTISENIGEIYFEKKDYAKAVSYYEKSIKALGTAANSSFAYNGIGKVYLKQGNYTQALVYHKKALAIAENLGSKPNMIKSLEGIADVYKEQKNFTTSLDYYNKATALAEEIKATPDLKDLYSQMALAYSGIADFKNAFKYQSLYADIKDTLYNIDTDKKLGRLQFEFDLQKKEGEINLLTKDKALTKLQLKRQKFAKRVLIGGLSLAFMIALLIFRSYLIKRKTNKILDRQKGEIESLLLNILPAEVAKELQVHGHATPRNYESVSVMFTDFKGFTTIADKMHPQELVEELNACFMAFDNIIEKYNLEKIKTIGDSYMCAGGIPTPDENHVFNMIKASLEIKDYIIQNNKRRGEAGLESWYLRIGIHVGPIVAGVVGKKKYAYDIWGSTVNIASRMESNGEPGKVNISSDTYELIKDKYDCIYRGKISAKNIGEIDMYFVDREIKIPEQEAHVTFFGKEKTEPLFYEN